MLLCYNSSTQFLTMKFDLLKLFEYRQGISARKKAQELKMKES